MCPAPDNEESEPGWLSDERRQLEHMRHAWKSLFTDTHDEAVRSLLYDELSTPSRGRPAAADGDGSRASGRR